MSNLYIRCEATGAIVPESDSVKRGWGIERTYSKEGAVVIDAYLQGLNEAATSARKQYNDTRETLKAEFKASFPEGKLPDDNE